MKDLVFDIFNALAETAMKESHDIELKYENSQHEGKTFISQSKTDVDELTLTIHPNKMEEARMENDEEDEEGDEE